MDKASKPLPKIIPRAITAAVYILSIYIILKHDRGEHSIWDAPHGFILYHISSAAIIYFVFYEATHYQPKQEKTRQFYIMAICSNTMTSFIFCFYTCYLGYYYAVPFVSLIWYYIMNFCYNFIIYQLSKEIKVNKLILWVYDDILFVVCFALMMWLG